MKKEINFDGAIWIGAKEKNICPLIKQVFNINVLPESAQLKILGFGTFEVYINGEKVSDELFLPLNSNYGERENFPKNEKMRCRAYAEIFDIGGLIRRGDNTICVLLGSGWYNGNSSDIPYGDKKVIYSVCCDRETIVSDMSAKYMDSFVKESDFCMFEKQDFSAWQKEFITDTEFKTNFKNVEEKEPLDCVVFSSDCPRDKIIETIKPVAVKRADGYIVYDAGKNLSGFPVLKALNKNEKVEVFFSEELDSDNEPDSDYMHGQVFSFVSGGGETTDKTLYYPRFTWFGFRYFKVVGNAEAINVAYTHSDIKISSSFDSDNEVLNWIYNAFLNTQLSNMHRGIPSDCPHIERRGYTGDGQLTAKSAMLLLDAKSFYAKWIEDIADCQDEISGHVQYTAPYTYSGGGPGGWGCAIVMMPYYYFIYYNDDKYIREMFPRMLRYFDYMEAHSANDLVISDQEGLWCLGDWEAPEPIVLPAPFVNTYFYILSMQKVIEIAEYLHENDIIPVLQDRIIQKKQALTNAYFNSWDGNFLGGVQGANAFAADIGLGDERTKKNLAKRYSETGVLDTGIFGTELVIKVLLETGEYETAYRLLNAESPHGYGKWKKIGATTFWESWDNARSHNHPMFGSVIYWIFEYFLGIKVGQQNVTPYLPKEMNYMKGSVRTADGRITVTLKRVDGKVLTDVQKE